MKKLLALLLAATALTHWMPPRASAAELTEWRHGIIEPKSDAGFALIPLQERFTTPQGLHVTIVPVQSDQIGLKAMLSGDLDSYDGAPNSAIVAASRGADVKVVACAWPHLVQGIFVTSDIHTLADLKGKAVGISQPGAMPDMVMRAALKDEGVAATDIRFASLGADADRFKSMVAGLIQGAVISTEFSVIAPPDIKLYKALRDVMPKFLRGCTMTSGKTIATRKEAIAHLIAAEMQGLRVATTDKALEVKVTQERTHAKPDDQRAAYIWDNATKYGDIDATMPLPLDKILWMQDLLLANGSMTKKMDITALADPSVRELALTYAK